MLRGNEATIRQVRGEDAASLIKQPAAWSAKCRQVKSGEWPMPQICHFAFDETQWRLIRVNYPLSALCIFSALL